MSPKKTLNQKFKKITTVRSHPLQVPPSKKNPTGITIRHQHPRRIYESTNAIEIKQIFKSYKKNKLLYPAAGCFPEYKNGDLYDDQIAVWCDYFNKKFPPTPPQAALNPNVVKALIASESDFRIDPRNPQAIGIAQITPATLKILLDPDGEAKDFIFKDIHQKDLNDPEIAIPIAIRWLFRKRATATNTLKRNPTAEELILEYKGLLKSKGNYYNNALEKFRGAYAKLNKK